jgi:hypothetical protein
LRRFLFGLFVLASLLSALSAVVSAQSISSVVSIAGVVPEMRFMYVNQDGVVTRIVGNTSNNIRPRVAGPDNKELPLTDAVWQQYAYFMEQHNWHLDGGVSYDVNPVRVNTSVSSQNIQINATQPSKVENLQLQAGLTPVFG